MTIRTLSLIAAVMLLAGCGGSAAGRHATLIAFTRYRLQDSPLWSEIWVARPDGTAARRVSGAPSAVEDDQAHFSPDGSWIVFDRCTAGGPCSIWLVHPDGSGQRKVEVPCGHIGCDDSNPSFMPDGRGLVFQHEWGAVKQGAIPDNPQIAHSWIVTTDLSGGHFTILRRFDRYRGGFLGPRISPDGKRLLFGAYAWHPSRIEPDMLYVADVGGGPARRVAPPALRAGSGEWSPDGKRILFGSSVGGGELTPGNALYTVGLDGSGLQRLTDVGAYYYVLAGSFSPDGKSIVYATNDKGAGSRGFADIVTQRIGAKTFTSVTRSENLDGWPTWGVVP